MSDKLKTIHFDNFKLEVTQEQFDGMKEYMEIYEEEGKYVCYSPSYEGFDGEEPILWLRRGSIWNQNKLFEEGDGSFYQFEGTDLNNQQLEKYNFFQGYYEESLFLKDNTTKKFLKFDDIKDFDVDDVLSFDNSQTDENEFYLLKDFDIEDYLKSEGNILD